MDDLKELLLPQDRPKDHFKVGDEVYRWRTLSYPQITPLKKAKIITILENNLYSLLDVLADVLGEESQPIVVSGTEILLAWEVKYLIDHPRFVGDWTKQWSDTEAARQLSEALSENERIKRALWPYHQFR